MLLLLPQGRALMVKLSRLPSPQLPAGQGGRLSPFPGSAPSSVGCRTGSSRHWAWELGLPAKWGQALSHSGATRAGAALAQRASGVLGG